MSLRNLAERDLAAIVEDESGGFAWPITLTDPSGRVEALSGLSNDISQLIDPDTGQAVSGRLAGVALRVSSILALGLELPKGVADSKSKPWIVEFNDINGKPHKFKVAQSNPDRALGIITLILEAYA